jgi:hypothetical protein
MKTMKKIVYNLIYVLMVSGIATTLMVLPGCKKETSNAPVINGVRSYLVSPGDSVINSLVPGQWVVLLGHNLKGAVQISFNGVPASFNSALFSDTSAAVMVPAVIPFPTVSADQLNTIRYVTPNGTTTFTFNIVAPPPTITSISNENANQGDSVRIYGLNFFFIKSISFAGASVTSWKEANDGTSVGFVLPALTQSGPVVITTNSGSAATVFNVNDVTTGALCNYDNVNTYSWGATGTSNSSVNFPGNRGWYAILQNGILNANEWSWWNGGRSMNTNGVQWVPKDSLGVPPANYTVKFEVSSPSVWNGGSFYIVKDYSTAYVGRYEPWKDASGASFNFSTTGWRTVTIPLSLFLTNNGTGTAPAKLTDLLGSNGSGSFNIWVINNSPSATTTGTNVAVDNIRIVKIK